MRKISPKLKRHYKSLQQKKRIKEKRAVNRKRKKSQRSQIFHNRNAYYLYIKQRRTDLLKSVFNKRLYLEKPYTIKIDGQFGIEENGQVENFLNFASGFVDKKSRHLNFDFDNCSRVWPSAITLLCSLKQWVEITASHSKPPKISSSSSKSDNVNSYLAHSGFYDYVQRPKETSNNYYSNDQIVKIEREEDSAKIEPRENEIVRLIEQYGALNKDEIEEFNDVILTEAFNNVLEHGKPYRDRGWWLLAQYHKTHNFISLCIADNGIGIRNSLMTGPQANELSNRIDNTDKNDGEFIKIACEENTSGSLAASVKKGKLLKRYESGSRRGNGLHRIITTCKKLMIPFAILSYNGYLFYDKYGKLTFMGAKGNRVFAGTMFHFKIKAN